MSTSQELIDYLNDRITALDTSIAVKEQEKLSLDIAIEEQETNIISFNNQKDATDGVIAGLNTEKAKISEIIALIPV